MHGLSAVDTVDVGELGSARAGARRSWFGACGGSAQLVRHVWGARRSWCGTCGGLDVVDTVDEGELGAVGAVDVLGEEGSSAPLVRWMRGMSGGAMGCVREIGRGVGAVCS